MICRWRKHVSSLDGPLDGPRKVLHTYPHESKRPRTGTRTTQNVNASSKPHATQFPNPLSDSSRVDSFLSNFLDAV